MRVLCVLLIGFGLLSVTSCEASSHTDMGHSTRVLQRNGWSIHLDNVGTASVTESDWGTTIEAGGHKIVVGDGVTVDDHQVANGRAGTIRVANKNGVVSLTVNGNPVELK